MKQSLALIILACVSCLYGAEDAADFEAKGIAALKLSQTESDAVVAATIYFGQAAASYDQAGDSIKATEMNSFLYWCKKKMTLAQMDAFLKGGDAITLTVARRMKEMEQAAPPPDDAKNYFDRAEAYAKAHPDEHLLIAIRFFETADRFKGTELSFKAQDRSLQEMTLATQSTAAVKAAPPPVAAAVKKLPVPSPAQQKESEKTIRDIFKPDLAKAAPADKLAVSKKFAQQAQETADDASGRFVLLTLAAGLAAQAGSLDDLVAALDNISATFDGDVSTVAKSNFSILISSTRDAAISKIAVACRTLLEKPDDASANLAAGKYFCFAKGDLERGMPMLAKSAHPALSKIAKQDLSSPQQPPSQIELGDAWWDLAEKSTDKEEKPGYFLRAKYWYLKALPSTSGLGKAKLEKRIEEAGASAVAASVRTVPPASTNSAAPTKADLVLDLGKGETLELMYVKKGTFQMGGDKQHLVNITKPYYIGKYHVTQEQYEALMDANPSQNKGAKNPVEKVSWHDAQTFCEKLNERAKANLPAGLKVQLPTEAQWEYACRATTKTRYYSGDAESDLDAVGWYEANSGGRTHPVGEKKPNAWGLYDMHGNVWQWCQDWKADYKSGTQSDPQGPAQGDRRVFRGGAVSHPAGHCSAPYRDCNKPDGHYQDVGFRIVVAVPLTAR